MHFAFGVRQTPACCWVRNDLVKGLAVFCAGYELVGAHEAECERPASCPVFMVKLVAVQNSLAGEVLESSPKTNRKVILEQDCIFPHGTFQLFDAGRVFDRQHLKWIDMNMNGMGIACGSDRPFLSRANGWALISPVGVELLIVDFPYAGGAIECQGPRFLEPGKIRIRRQCWQDAGIR